MFLTKSYIWEKSCSWVIGKNVLSQSDCRIFKSTISPEQVDETASFFACWHKFTKIRSWSKFFWLGMVKNWCGQSGLWTLKMTGKYGQSGDGTLENWLYLKNEQLDKLIFCMLMQIHEKEELIKFFWVGMVKNRCDQLGCGTLKLTVSHKWADGIN